MIKDKRLRNHMRKLLTTRERFCNTLDNLTGLLTLPVRSRDLTRLTEEVEELKRRRNALRGEVWAMRGFVPPGFRARSIRKRDKQDPVEEAAGLVASVRADLRRASRAISTIELVCEAPRTPVYLELDRADPRSSQIGVLDRAYDVLHMSSRSGDQDQTAIAAGAHADIPLAASLFLAHVHVAWRVLAALGRTERASFLDVGSGAGSKVVLAAQVFAQADGLELDPGYAAASRELLSSRYTSNTATIEGNALEFDGYHRYDLIYFFLPIRDRDAMHALETKIITDARPGTVFIAPYAGFLERAEPQGVSKIAGNVSINATSAGEAALLLDEARLIGPLLPGPDGLVPSSRDGLLAPTLHALRLIGFAT
ncbi:MAG: hypothetical protein AAFR46_06125 [Pseudomonadota bacterium]